MNHTGSIMRAQALADASKFQKLSLREAGAFDKKFILASKDGKVTSRLITTRWTSISLGRQTVSRKARIRAAKQTAQAAS